MDDLSTRALKGLARFQVALALIIFLPAWSLTYWQGWLYWFLFGTACFALTLYFLRHDPSLVERRMNAGPGAETEPRQKLIMTVASAGMIALYLVSALDYGFGWSDVPAAVSLIANAFVLLGFAGIFWTFRENTYAAATVRVESGQPVIETGPYALVRHPMYAAALPLFLATPPALGSWYGLIPAAVVVATIVWRLLDEEQHLARGLPGYAEYRGKVRAWLVPGVW
ncbi:MAG: isoprenylcysteine carboxylmethyltransferase family protein [Xanthobacteraceae bacterium]